jgi:hypothetical protein
MVALSLLAVDLQVVTIELKEAAEQAVQTTY